ncbi:hypothetical protein R6231_14555 [Bacillus cytotoxicus]|nr:MULTISPECIES: hypothetical protein [Bacillus cereus group]AWC30998.1 hypothetical protein CG483_022530 [Bacillus cytotoxicus]AWC35054.1 hypothetical protein CG482_022615 [Bacillus cytotoxicus]AWC39093.1 hypothetical protein CG481_022620 [Bacillus cytotoxicus]AWC43090.1 hypothetical protein CG480_022365 [Bacillus cytotoxicus]AWC46997.1 hypothetical protein CG479_021585 [Bacillus cytotoxicus]
MSELKVNLQANKILKSKSISVGFFELDERYSLGKKITVFCNNLNALYTFTVFNITLVKKTHWVVHLK